GGREGLSRHHRGRRRGAGGGVAAHLLRAVRRQGGLLPGRLRRRPVGGPRPDPGGGRGSGGRRLAGTGPGRGGGVPRPSGLRARLRDTVPRPPAAGWFNRVDAVRVVSHGDLVLFGHVGLAFVLCYAVGFERALRGAPAGDRTYSLVGTAAAAISAVTVGPAP